ncbi:MAG: Ni/Fe-hydrogenase, b-type cytochrome subunit [Bryobacteraceae bacterium]
MQNGVEVKNASPFVRVYVWELPVRLAHWIIVLDLMVLAFTGTYMHDPFFVAVGRRAWVMGTMRFIHLLAAFIFISAFIWRFYWFFAGNRWAHWNQFLPFRKERRAGMNGMLKYYAFLRWRPVSEVGHNALAGAAYAAVYSMVVIEILTGLALFDNVLGNRILHFFIGWLPRLIDLQYLRAIHFGVMFLFGMFLIHHVYSAILISKEEKSGLLESIFTGYKYIREVPAATHEIVER